MPRCGGDFPDFPWFTLSTHSAIWWRSSIQIIINRLIMNYIYIGEGMNGSKNAVFKAQDEPKDMLVCPRRPTTRQQQQDDSCPQTWVPEVTALGCGRFKAASPRSLKDSGSSWSLGHGLWNIVEDLRGLITQSECSKSWGAGQLSWLALSLCDHSFVYETCNQLIMIMIMDEHHLCMINVLKGIIMIGLLFSFALAWSQEAVRYLFGSHTRHP